MSKSDDVLSVLETLGVDHLGTPTPYSMYESSNSSDEDLDEMVEEYITSRGGIFAFDDGSWCFGDESSVLGESVSEEDVGGGLLGPAKKVIKAGKSVVVHKAKGSLLTSKRKAGKQNIKKIQGKLHSASAEAKRKKSLAKTLRKQGKHVSI